MKNDALSSEKKKPTERCPHCGSPLSAWEQVLLEVDRAFVCKHCWYRIVLPIDTSGKPEVSPPDRIDDAEELH